MDSIGTTEGIHSLIPHEAPARLSKEYLDPNSMSNNGLWGSSSAFCWGPGR